MSRTGENIYKRKDGRWEGRYILFYDGNGKAKYKSVYAHSYFALRNKLLIAKSQNSVTSPEKSILGRENYELWLNKWLNAKRVLVKDSTYIRYRNHINNHIVPELGRFPINKISTCLIEEFISKKLEHGRIDASGGLSQKTVSDILGVMKDSFKYARSHGADIICSFENVSFRHTTREMRVLSIGEEKRLLKTLFNDFDRYKLGVFLCLYTGIRIGELCALTGKDISLEDRTLNVRHTMQRLQVENVGSSRKTQVQITDPKSSAGVRVIPLPEFVVDVIKPYVGSENSFILSGSGRLFVEPRTMENRFKHYLSVSQIEKATFHSLRHTFATRCIEAGIDAKTLSEILGHSSVKITLDKYVHSSLQQKRDSMEKLPFLLV